MNTTEVIETIIKIQLAAVAVAVEARLQLGGLVITDLVVAVVVAVVSGVAVASTTNEITTITIIERRSAVSTNIAVKATVPKMIIVANADTTARTRKQEIMRKKNTLLRSVGTIAKLLRSIMCTAARNTPNIITRRGEGEAAAEVPVGDYFMSDVRDDATKQQK